MNRDILTFPKLDPKSRPLWFTATDQEYTDEQFSKSFHNNQITSQNMRRHCSVVSQLTSLMPVWRSSHIWLRSVGLKPWLPPLIASKGILTVVPQQPGYNRAKNLVSTCNFNQATAVDATSTLCTTTYRLTPLRWQLCPNRKGFDTKTHLTSVHLIGLHWLICSLSRWSVYHQYSCCVVPRWWPRYCWYSVDDSCLEQRTREMSSAYLLNPIFHSHDFVSG